MNSSVMSRAVRAEVLAQCLAERFPGEDWEWNEVADWLVGEFLPTEARLGRLKSLLDLEGAVYVGLESPTSPLLERLAEGMGLRVEQRSEHGRMVQVLVRG